MTRRHYTWFWLSKLRRESFSNNWLGAAGWGWEWGWSGYEVLAFTAAVVGRGVTVDLQGDTGDRVLWGAPAAQHLRLTHDSRPTDIHSNLFTLSLSATPWTLHQKYSAMYCLRRKCCPRLSTCGGRDLLSCCSAFSSPVRASWLLCMLYLLCYMHGKKHTGRLPHRGKSSNSPNYVSNYSCPPIYIARDV